MRLIARKVEKQSDSWRILVTTGLNDFPLKTGDILKSGQKVLHVISMSMLFPKQSNKQRNYGMILDKEVYVGDIIEK